MCPAGCARHHRGLTVIKRAADPCCDHGRTDTMTAADLFAPFASRRPSRPAFAAWALSGSVLLTACATVTPSREPAVQAVSVPPQWSQPVPPGAQPLAHWWRHFDDEGLVRWVDAALAASTDIATARAQWQRARAAGRLAEAGLAPTLGVTASTQRARPAAGGAAASLFQAGFDASWEPDVWGGQSHAVQAAQADEQAARAALAATQVAVAAEMAQLFVQWRSLQQRAAHTESSLQTQEQTLQLVRWRRQAGLAGALEVEQARSAAEQLRALLPQIRTSQAQTRHAMALLAGLAANASGPEVRPDGGVPQPPRELAVAVPAAALRQRPDIQAALAQMEAAAERVAQADASRRPTLAMRASTAWSALTLSSLGGAPAALLLAGSVSQPLFDGGRRDAAWAVQAAAFDVAAEAYRARVLQALQEVQDALAGIDGARWRLQALQQADEASAQAALLARHRYVGGLVDFQSVLDTQRTRLSVQDGLAQAQADWAIQHIRLVKALGGGWEAAQPGQGATK